MSKTKIIAPNKDYNGESAGIKFTNGVGETDDPDLITWFKERGYKVESSKSKDETPKSKDETPKSKDETPKSKDETPKSKVE